MTVRLDPSIPTTTPKSIEGCWPNQIYSILPKRVGASQRLTPIPNTSCSKAKVLDRRRMRASGTQLTDSDELENGLDCHRSGEPVFSFHSFPLPQFTVRIWTLNLPHLAPTWRGALFRHVPLSFFCASCTLRIRRTCAQDVCPESSCRNRNSAKPYNPNADRQPISFASLASPFCRWRKKQRTWLAKHTAQPIRQWRRVAELRNPVGVSQRYPADEVQRQAVQ